jgi:hypothetical protein
MALRLLIETPAPDDQYEYVIEEKSGNQPSTMYIKGPYMQCEEVNKNKRIYDSSEMDKEVNRYISEMVKTNRSMGELNHPTAAEVNLERACHLVTELNRSGNVYYGKSKVLTTPMGQIVRSLVNDGVRVGMSSRALGKLEECGNGVNRVKEFRLVAVDCVADPSFPKAFVNGILESKQFVVTQDGRFEEFYDGFSGTLKNLPRKDVEGYLKEQILEFFNKISKVL